MHRRYVPGRLLAFLLVVLVAFSVAHGSPAPSPGTSTPAPLVIEGLGKGTVALGGPWQFHLGDDPGWASPTLNDSGWEQITVDDPWGAQQHYGYTGYAWYRRHVDFVPVAGFDSDLSLSLSHIDDVYEVYWNGAPIGHLGKMPPGPVWYNTLPRQVYGLGRPRSGVLAIRVWKAPYSSADPGELGGLYAPPLVGSPAAIASSKAAADYGWLRGSLYFFGIDILYALIGLLGLLSWLRNRRQKLLFWMSVWALGLLLSTVLTGLRIQWPVGISQALSQPLLSLSDISVWYLLLYLLELDKHRFLPRLTKLLAIVSLVATGLDGALLLLDWSGPHILAIQIADAVLTVPVTLVEVYPLVLVVYACRKRLDAARWLVAILAAAGQLTLGFRNGLGQGVRFTHWKFPQAVNGTLFTVGGVPFSLLTLEFTLLLLAIVFAVYRYSVEQSKRQGAIEQEFKSAQELQQVLIPETLPSLEGYAVTSAYRPAQQVGGDFFQLIALPDGGALLILGDVSGKGLKAAMTVSLIVGTVRTVAEVFDDPAEILARLNVRLCGRLQNGFVTCVVLRLDADGSGVLANAGHLNPFLNKHELDMPPALPLGLDPAASYELTSFELAIGDRLTVYTDGLLEARSAAGEIYGFERLRELIATEPDAKQAIEAAVAFGQEDDITVITLTRLATGVEPTTSLAAPTLVASTA